jgi:hypothetical protein
MFVVIRETTYAPDISLEETPQFREFQSAHAGRPGYEETLVACVGAGRYVTVTLWQTAEDMNAAREALGPVVQRLLDPLMTMPSTLIGTGKVVFDDLRQG